MKKRMMLIAILVMMLLQARVSLAQNAPNAPVGVLEIKQSVVANGGGASSGGAFSLESTIGQSLAGNLLQNSSFSLLSGFQTGNPLAPQQSSVTISGKVTNGANALSGVLVTLGGASNAAVATDASGNYSFANLTGGLNYTVTPSLANSVFTPPSFTFNNVSANQTANFVATQCVYSLNPNGTNVPAAETSGTFGLTAPAGCAWTAVSNNNWLSVTSATSGNGAATVSYSVAANAGAQRTGSITIAGQNFLVTQSGVNDTTISGSISYGITTANQAVKFVSGVVVSATGSSSASANTDSAGSYLLNNLVSNGQYTVTSSKTNDVNGITAFDATLVLRCVAAGQNCTLTNNQRLAADANNNGTMSAFDATQILRYVAAGGSTPNTGAAGQWKFSPAPRSYGSVSSPLSGQNFEAVLIGEVNGSWTAPSNFANTDEAENQLDAEKSAAANFSEVESEQQFEISLPKDIAAAKDSIVTIPVSLKNNPTRTVASYNFTVHFDSSILKPDAAMPFDANTTSSNGFSVVSDVETAGQIGIAAANANGKLLPSGTLLNLRFKVVGEPNETSKLSFVGKSNERKPLFEDKDGNRESVKAANGLLKISAQTDETTTISGRVTTADNRGIRNVQVQLIDEKGEVRTVLTEAFGNYRFASIPTKRNYTITVTAKKYNFSQPTQTRSINAETNDVDFRADN